MNKAWNSRTEPRDEAEHLETTRKNARAIVRAVQGDGFDSVELATIDAISDVQDILYELDKPGEGRVDESWRDRATHTRKLLAGLAGNDDIDPDESADEATEGADEPLLTELQKKLDAGALAIKCAETLHHECTGEVRPDALTTLLDGLKERVISLDELREGLFDAVGYGDNEQLLERVRALQSTPAQGDAPAPSELAQGVAELLELPGATPEQLLERLAAVLDEPDEPERSGLFGPGNWADLL